MTLVVSWRGPSHSVLPGPGPVFIHIHASWPYDLAPSLHKHRFLWHFFRGLPSARFFSSYQSRWGWVPRRCVSTPHARCPVRARRLNCLTSRGFYLYTREHHLRRSPRRITWHGRFMHVSCSSYRHLPNSSINPWAWRGVDAFDIYR